MDELGIGHVISAFSAVVFEHGVTDDDLADRLNYWIMYGILLFFGISVGAKQYVGEPIFCWPPPEYTDKRYKRYINHYCWVHTMYEVPWDQVIPSPENERYINDVGFYRWSTVFFIFLAFMYRIPKFVWKEMKLFSGINVEKIVGMTLETANMEQEKREKQLGHVAVFLHRWISTYSDIPTSNTRLKKLRRAMENFFICYGKRRSHYLVIIYLFVKFLYLANVVVQFFIISAFLNLNFWSFGTDVIASFAAIGEWVDDVNFPRVALCDFQIRQLSNVQTYTSQCVLTLNIFLEKMFLVLWFLLAFMLAANLFSFTKWCYQLLSQRKRTEFITKYTGMIPSGSMEHLVTEKSLKHLVRRYLKADGVFVLKMVESNTTDLLTVDLIRQVWLQYTEFCKDHLPENTEFSRMENGIIKRTLETDI
ncbi:innexin unc-9-like [Biomphalaria glabrata]|uniref:Innexin n=1 Tax=Biomphalaria glabrata TaxID=6526 RepID=A0A9W2Z666_BIOGL|nr:innexin unc-9-like [Biomphalaria glabrata]